MKRLPVELPHEADRRNGTLGYATVRQAPNGLIHVLATMTHPCLHYEFNEAWVFSNEGEIEPETAGGRVEQFSEKYASGRTRITWSARICPNGRYLLDGVQTAYYENGRKQHEATFAAGRKTGEETFWAPDGTRRWTWNHQPNGNRSTWTHYWKNGQKRIESEWSTRHKARDLDRQFVGLVAHGETRHFDESGRLTTRYRFVDGKLESNASQ